MNKNVPKLRFKGFNDEWENKKIEEVTSYVDYRGKTPTKTDSGRFLVTAKNIKMGYIDYEKSQEFISEESYPEAMRRGLPKIGDVLLTTEAPLGNVAQIDREDIALAQRVIKFRGTQEIDNSYLKQYFLSDKFQKALVNKAIGTTVLGIQGKVLHKMKINIPSLQEQEKIADFFTILDSLIEEQDGKVSDLELYKKGMMQKIFSQEIRFKDENGCDYPAWTKQKLGDISRIIMGQSPSSAAYNENNEGLPLVQGNADINNRVTTPRVYTNEITKTCEVKDIIMSVRAPVGTIAIANQVCCIGRGVCAIKSNSDQNYLYQVLLEKESKWSKISQGSTFESINSNDIKSLIVNLPSFQEQNKIAEFLLNIDNLIAEEKKKLDDLIEMKKGLLQQMFV